MKNWIELTGSNGRPRFVNLARVELIIPSNEEGCNLSFTGNDSYVFVKESYSEVVLMIHRADEDEIAMQHTERVGNVEVRETIYQQSNDVPVRVDSTGRPSNCNKSIAQLGKAMPRTCQACGLGPCKYGR